MGELLHDITTASRQQVALRVSIAVAALLLALILFTAGEVSPWALAVLSGLGALVALNPHTEMPGVLMVYTLVTWWVAVDAPWHPLALPMALCLLFIHVASALAAGMPAQAAIPARLWLLYWPRLALVAMATGAFWVLAGMHAMSDLPGGPYAVLSAFVVLGAGLVVHYLFITRRTGPSHTKSS